MVYGYHFNSFRYIGYWTSWRILWECEIGKGNKWITDNALYISSFKTKNYSLEFLEELMKMCNFHQFADASAQPKITQKPLENLTYIIPPIELQNEFAEFVKLIDKSKFIVQQQIKDLQELLDSKWMSISDKKGG